jgi:hypothetical protein
MAPFKKRIIWFFGQALFAAVLITGTAIWCDFTSNPLFKRVPLTEDIGGAWADVSKEFDQRVKATFPLGASVEDLQYELGRQGFSREGWITPKLQADHSLLENHSTLRIKQNYTTEPEHMAEPQHMAELEYTAVRHESNIACDIAYYIHWRTNSNGKLTSIRGEVPIGACL